jgi:hypothetical protein
MVAMTVGQQDMGGACDGRAALVFGEDRAAGEPGVDQQRLPADLEAEAGMAKPGKFHAFPSIQVALSRIGRAAQKEMDGGVSVTG